MAVTNPRPDAFYFDYKRRNDPEFRKALKRDKKRHAKTQKLQAEAAHAEQRQTLIASVRDAQLVGFPTDVEEKEAFFMNEVATGEALCQEGSFFSSLSLRINLFWGFVLGDVWVWVWVLGVGMTG